MASPDARLGGFRAFAGCASSASQPCGRQGRRISPDTAGQTAAGKTKCAERRIRATTKGYQWRKSARKRAAPTPPHSRSAPIRAAAAADAGERACSQNRYTNPQNETMAKLTKAERDKLPSKDFALPKTRQFPIEDRGHAEAALREMGHESKKNQAAIRKAVAKKFPGVGGSRKARKKPPAGAR